LVNMFRNRSVSRDRSASARDAKTYTPPYVPEAASPSHHLASSPGHDANAGAISVPRQAMAVPAMWVLNGTNGEWIR
jgi:hypothetical protein